MKKNNYCLMLSEGVVNAIDLCAAREGTNRSALINRILAEYVSYITPEMRAAQIMSSVRQALESGFRYEAQSESMLSLCSTLAYRYNPTVKYCLELYRGGDLLGEIRLSLRTTNRTVLFLLERFSLAFARVEERMIGNCQYTLQPGKLSRILRLRKNDGISDLLSFSDLGKLVAEYIAMLDSALKAFFAYYTPDERAAVLAVESVYSRYLSSAKILL